MHSETLLAIGPSICEYSQFLGPVALLLYNI